MLGFGKNKKIPIGYEDFKLLIDGGFYYVDKTMLIYDLLSFGGQNNLITRPRRFGKTLNFSMLRYFFDVNEKENAYLFDGTKIMAHADEVAPYRNAFPVISLSLKSAKQGSFDRALFCICTEIREQFIKYSYVLDGDKLTDVEKRDYRRILECETADERLFGTALKKLSSALAKYYGQNTVIFIDEYDMPLDAAYLYGYYDEMVAFIRTMFESALKTNPSLQFSLITGSLHVLNESIFSAINNIEVNSIRSKAYSSFFGFTDDEVEGLMDYYRFDGKKSDLEDWYGGYFFGGQKIYNPWSVLHQMKQWSLDGGSLPERRWKDMSYNDFLGTSMTGSGAYMIRQMKELLGGGEISSPVYDSIPFDRIKNDAAALYTFLYYIGHLTIVGTEVQDGKTLCRLKIPNREIRLWYDDMFGAGEAGTTAAECSAADHSANGDAGEGAKPAVEENPLVVGNKPRENKDEDDGRFSRILG
ncbi:MAG: AAA family ATPase [Clostridia bacterium]|nr:AAA family ATPase [Clostridia bacterium]